MRTLYVAHSRFLLGDVSPEPYRDLLTSAVPAGLTVQVVVRDQRPVGATGTQLLASFAAAPGGASRRGYRWPGTRLRSGDGVATLHTAPLTDELLALLLDASSGFGDWRSPKLPEDLALLRPDGSTWLGTVGRGSHAWLELSRTELEQLHARSSVVLPSWEEADGAMLRAA